MRLTARVRYSLTTRGRIGKEGRREGEGTILEIARRVSNADTSPVMARTPTEIADEFEAWYAAGAADGFNLMFPLLLADRLNNPSCVRAATREADAQRICKLNASRPARFTTTTEPLHG
jgi:alkanesulfonate monooxygenase SsuD/methylene tetrahydromethanopterin reductase-like flavin-dependent oxidoreductase (luciferase family)